MACDLSELESRYLNACMKQEVLPNSFILSSLLKVKHQKLQLGHCCLEIFIDQLICSDLPPLIDALSGSSLSDIDAVDLYQKSSNISLDGEYVLSLLNAINRKLRIVDLMDWSFWKDILRDICQNGTPCCILNLCFSPIRKLNLTGKFMQLHTLNLDFSVHLTSFHVSCFNNMPNLMQLSMCETRVANLWTTSASLSKLHSLVELRFQSCLCCYDTGPCSTAREREIANACEKCRSWKLHHQSHAALPSVTNENSFLQSIQLNSIDGASVDEYSNDDSFRNNKLHRSVTGSSEEYGLELSSGVRSTSGWPEISNDNCAELDGHTNSGITEIQSENTFSHTGPSPESASIQLLEEVCSRRINVLERMDSTSRAADATLGEIHNHVSHTGCINKDSNDMINLGSVTRTSDIGPRKHVSHHPSPICFEKYYREFMISSLPHLKVLDNIPIKNVEKDKAAIIFKNYYEYRPYNRQQKESVTSILKRRELQAAPWHSFRTKKQYHRESQHSFSRSLSAAKVSSSVRPHLHPLSNFRGGLGGDIKSFRPRQFEYHPTNPSLMVFGTLDGELVVINHESEKLIGYLPSVEALHSILGLCWLKKHPSKLISGSDNGSLRMYDVSRMPSTVTDRYGSTDASIHSFDEFEQLTSVHVNSTDEYFLASGFSKHVALYDITTGRRLQIFKDLHNEHINVVKFAHHSPTLFATASFDKRIRMWDLRQGTSRPCYTACNSKGNVMVCFSPDDQYLLSSAVDNEVKQLLAIDGRLHMSFNIASVGNAQNYTRSYYMNGRDYIISGSCEENVVRICCAQTGRRLRDVMLEGRGSRSSMFVQSLRGDPFRDFHMSVLAAYWHPFTKSEIIKVDLLQSDECTEEDSHPRPQQTSSVMGG
ncbi:protein DWD HYPERSENSITIVE TO UV-B 1 isoform X1 [Typha angustifolia]|uniref:protein DWD HYPERSENSITIVE TO UV-B 1 isoform X1 n=2 Tax=Typha angustifolia TaxID=59011 RepID=UPI003C2D008E